MSFSGNYIFSINNFINQVYAKNVISVTYASGNFDNYLIISPYTIRAHFGKIKISFNSGNLISEINCLTGSGFTKSAAVNGYILTWCSLKRIKIINNRTSLRFFQFAKFKSITVFIILDHERSGFTCFQ